MARNAEYAGNTLKEKSPDEVRGVRALATFNVLGKTSWISIPK